MSWLHRHLHPSTAKYAPPAGPPPGIPSEGALPPAWAPAEEESRRDGLFGDASTDDYEAGKRWCSDNPVESARFFASVDIERVEEQGCRVWELVKPEGRWSRFRGVIEDDVNYRAGSKGERVIRVRTTEKCGDTNMLSNLPLVAGMYGVSRGKEGVYYEVRIDDMQGCIAVGMF